MYRKDLDALKGIAIIAVVLFHMGLLKSGYLDVDAFFVINGFLVIPPVVRKIASGDFSFFGFMEKRIVRLLPLIVLASAVSLVLGYFLMLPDHYENLAQSVIAGNLMSENILSAITTRNYWDVVNEYKPLMHLWYVGILFEFYIVMPALLLVTNSTKNYGSCNGIIYKNRNLSDYFEQTAIPEPGYQELNDEWKQQWGEDYIDLFTPALVGGDRVRVFTDDRRYISQDCRHLSQAGAQWYARILDWREIFNNLR